VTAEGKPVVVPNGFGLLIVGLVGNAIQFGMG